MNILVVARGYSSENYPLFGIFEMDQAKALQACGHKVIYAAVDIRSIRRWRKWGYEFFERDGVYICAINVPVGAIPKKLKFFLSNWAFRSLYRRITERFGKPDIVHAHFGEVAHCVVETCKKANVPYVVTEHSSSINRDDLIDTQLVHYKYVYQNAAAVIAVSSVLANRIENYFSVKSVVIPNIVDLASFSDMKHSHKTFRFLSAGNLNEGKGFDVLLSAFKACILDGMNADLFIMGDGPEREHLDILVKKYSLSEHVCLAGKYCRSQFALELSNSDVFVLASRSETFGVVYAEAMASGIPVIATRCGGPEDFVTDEVGILVPADDVNALADAMRKMFITKNSYSSVRIVKYAKDNFSPESISKRLIQLYEEVLRKNRD